MYMSVPLGINMDNVAENEVLRTLYLPIAIDRRLRELAFTYKVTNIELMLLLINAGVEALGKAGVESLADKIELRISGQNFSALAEAEGESARSAALVKSRKTGRLKRHPPKNKVRLAG